MKEKIEKEYSIQFGSKDHKNIEIMGGIGKTVCSALIYGFTPSLCAITYSLGNNNMSMAFYRNLLIIPVVLIYLIGKKINPSLEKQQVPKVMLTASLQCLTTILLYSSYSFISVGMATTLHFLYPIFVIVFCKIIYDVKVNDTQKKSIYLSLIGISLFMLDNLVGNIKGIILAILSGVTFALYLTFLDKLRVSKIENFTLVFHSSLTAVIEMLLLNIRYGFLIVSLTFEVYALIFFIAIMTGLVGSILLKEGVRVLGSPLASYISLLEPISSIIFGVILLGESISVNQILGCIAIILSIINLTGFFKKCKEVTK